MANKAVTVKPAKHKFVVTHKEVLAFDDHRVYVTGDDGKLIMIFKNKLHYDLYEAGDWIEIVATKLKK